MTHLTTSLVLIGYTLSVPLAMRGLWRQKLKREVVVVGVLAIIAMALALPTAFGIELPRVSTALDLFLQRLLPDALVKSLGFKTP